MGVIGEADTQEGLGREGVSQESCFSPVRAHVSPAWLSRCREFLTADLGRWICMVIQASSNLRNVSGLLSRHCVTWSHWGWVDCSCGHMSFVSATPCCFFVKILFFKSKYCQIKKLEKQHIYFGVAKSVGISYRYLNSGHLVTDLF